MTEINLTNLPASIPTREYETIINSYVSKVKGRSKAIYQTGSSKFPGLSDIDLIVVPKVNLPDNGYYFSKSLRLGDSVIPPFLHEPFILPKEALITIKYTTHHKYKLLWGDDVLSGTEFDNSVSAMICTLFESLIGYQQFVLSINAGRSISSEYLVAVASSLRFSLALFSSISNQTDTESTIYGREVDVYRNKLIHEAHDKKNNVRSVFTLFCDSLSDLTRSSSEYFPHSADIDFNAHMISVLNCEIHPNYIDQNTVQHRNTCIRNCQKILRQMRAFESDMFNAYPYSRYLNELNDKYSFHPIVHRLLCAIYRRY